MSLIDLAAPAVEPIDLAYAKTFLRVDGTDEDALINTLIKTARHRVENMIGRTLIRRSFVFRSAVPAGKCFSLPRPPLLGVIRLTLIAENDQAVDIPNTDYTVTRRRSPAQVRLKSGHDWTDYLAEFTTLEVEFEAGYGDTPDDVPLPIRQAILLLLAHSYEYREMSETPAVPIMVDALLAPYRAVRL
ncbi:MAG: head-tail connector protein [Robiginitomaculum sp.]|nr:head-tail connector protein [Robiginitomaculum sp.]